MNKKMVITIIALMVLAIVSNIKLCAVDSFPNNSNIEKAGIELQSYLLKPDIENEKIPVYVYLKEQYDPYLLYQKVRELSRVERRETTINTLREFSNVTQADLCFLIKELEIKGQAEEVHCLWITNTIFLHAAKEALAVIDKHPDVALIEYDPMRKMISDESTTPGIRSQQNSQRHSNQTGEYRNVTRSIELINAPDVWELGLRGDGIVVAVLDSGINYFHEDIRSQMWEHPEYPNHGYNFISNSHNTRDDNRHGTIVAGVIAGNGTAGTITGAAPEATIMNLKVLDSQGSGTWQSISRGIQFALLHEADVLNLSLGAPYSNQPDRTLVRLTMANVLNAGVVAVSILGNEAIFGVRTPGDCPPPWLQPAQTTQGGLSSVISVGATDNNDEIWRRSSRGPVTWQSIAPFNDYPLNPGIGLIKPDICAPGVDIFTLSYEENNGYVTSLGTSLAAPAVTGVIALMISLNPELIPEEICAIIENTAVSLSEVKNNIYGSGRVDAREAIEAILTNGVVFPVHNPVPENRAKFVGPNPLLQWDVRSEVDSYNIYLGTDNPPIDLINGAYTEDNSYLVTQDLEPETKYYWRVNSIKNNNEYTGYVWSFETTLPQAAVNPHPTDLSQYAAVKPNLIWNQSCGATVYKVYLGSDNPPTNVLNGEVTTEYYYLISDELEPMTKYYWYIDAINGNGLTNSELWSFTTGLKATESFDSGDFSQFPWQLSHAGNQADNWYICNEVAYCGRYAARSGKIYPNSYTVLQVSFEFYKDGVFSFARKVNAYLNLSFLRFYVNNELQGQWTGDLDWETYFYPISEGFKTFKWVYSKDFYDDNTEDAVWIDNLIFPDRGVPGTPLLPPNGVECTNKLDHIVLRWELPKERPIILGYNIYHSINKRSGFIKLNDEIYTDNSFKALLTITGSYRYYVTTVYMEGESQPSQIVSTPIYEKLTIPIISGRKSGVNNDVTVFIESEDDGAVIFYTLDGRRPTPESALYERPFSINKNTLVQARSYKLNYLPSRIASKEFNDELSADDNDAVFKPLSALIYPNPIFADLINTIQNLNIELTASEREDVNVRIFNIKGQLVRELHQPDVLPHSSSLVWNLRDSNEQVVGTGLYLIRIKADREVIIKRLMVIN